MAAKGLRLEELIEAQKKILQKGPNPAAEATLARLQGILQEFEGGEAEPKVPLMDNIRALPQEEETIQEERKEESKEKEKTKADASSLSSTAARPPVAVKVTVDIDREQEKKQENAANKYEKIDKDLLKAILKLTKSFDLANKEKEKGSLGRFVSGKAEAIKQAFSLEGIIGATTGIRRDSGTLAGAALGSVLERREKKQQERQEKAEYIANFGDLTEQGRKIKEENPKDFAKKLAEVAGPKFEQLKEARKALEPLEEQERRAKRSGIALSEDQKKALKKQRDIVKGVDLDVIIEENIKSVEEQEKISNVTNQLNVEKEDARKVVAESESLDKPVTEKTEDNPVLELLEVNKKQSDILEGILKNTSVSEEDKLESEKKESLSAITERTESTKVDKKEEDGSLLKLIAGGISSALSGPLTAIAGALGLSKLATKGAGLVRAAASVASGASKAIGLGTTAAIAAGGFAKKGVTKITELVTGMSKAIPKTVPTIPAAGSLTPPMMSTTAGPTSAIPEKTTATPKPIPEKPATKVSTNTTQPLKNAGKKAAGAAKAVLGKLGPIALLGMAAYDGITGFNKASENLDIDGREATTGEKMASAGGSILSGLTFGLVDEKTLSKSLAGFFGAGSDLEKMPDATRIKQTQELTAQTARREAAKNDPRRLDNAPSVVNNSPTTIVNNNTTTKEKFPVRNIDPTYVQRMERHFVFQ